MHALPIESGLSTAPPREAHPDDWQILRVLSIYRLTLVGALAILFYSKIAPAVLGQVAPGLFQTVTYAYLAASAIFVFLLQRHWPPESTQVYIQFGVDTAALTVIAYASGGVPSGLATLLITPTVACSLILGARISVLMAALATMSLFGEEIFRQYNGQWNPGDVTQTGILGGILMITALAANLVAVRARTSEARAREVGTELASMARLNESILELLQTGVVVVDAKNRVRSVNAAARRLLASPVDPLGQSLTDCCSPLADQLARWRQSRQFEPTSFTHPEVGSDLFARFTQLGWGLQAPILVLLDDTAEMRRQAQQMKLAALGRLSASIAHEIRNPLSAITQAGQLLGETEQLDGQGRRLVDMVQRHSRRIDRIVSDVLSLSRRERAEPETFALGPWLDRCIETYRESAPGREPRLERGAIPDDLQIRFDPGHLQQVLHNLWDNAIEHGGRRIRIRAERIQDGHRAYLETADDGPGIPADLREQIFEPFFTTAHDGTGLGLFMARELCEYNRAQLQLMPPEESGARFRILFAPEERSYA